MPYSYSLFLPHQLQRSLVYPLCSKTPVLVKDGAFAVPELENWPAYYFLCSEPRGREGVDCLLPCLFSQLPVVSSHMPEDKGGGEQPREARAVWVSQRAFNWWALTTEGPHHPAAETTGSCQVDAFRGVDNSSWTDESWHLIEGSGKGTLLGAALYFHSVFSKLTNWLWSKWESHWEPSYMVVTHASKSAGSYLQWCWMLWLVGVLLVASKWVAVEVLPWCCHYLCWGRWLWFYAAQHLGQFQIQCKFTRTGDHLSFL